MPRLLYYAQTFPGATAASLQRLADARLPDVGVYLSSLHIGEDPTTHKPYLHLNDADVRDQTAFLADVRTVCAGGDLRVMAMLGGAGGAYTALFADFEPRYALLRAFLQQHPWITGLDLDVEEALADDPDAALANIRQLIRRLAADMGDAFTLTMAPVAYALTGDDVGMGNFRYKALYATPEGQRLDWFNVQAYGCYDAQTYAAIVANGYPPEKLVFGMLGDLYEGATAFGDAMTELETAVQAHSTGFGGAVLWEYGDTQVDPVTWGQAVERAMVAGLVGAGVEEDGGGHNEAVDGGVNGCTVG